MTMASVESVMITTTEKKLIELARMAPDEMAQMLGLDSGEIESLADEITAAQQQVEAGRQINGFWMEDAEWFLRFYESATALAHEYNAIGRKQRGTPPQIASE